MIRYPPLLHTGWREAKIEFAYYTLPDDASHICKWHSNLHVVYYEPAKRVFERKKNGKIALPSASLSVHSIRLAAKLASAQFVFFFSFSECLLLLYAVSACVRAMTRAFNFSRMYHETAVVFICSYKYCMNRHERVYDVEYKQKQ